MAERTAWRICSANGWCSVFGKKRGRNGKPRKPGTPAFEDLVKRGLLRWSGPAAKTLSR